MTETWLADVVSDDEAAALTSELVAYRSYPGEEGPVQRHVATWLEAAGLAPELQATEGDRPNVIARVENGDGPTLLLNGHTDTVLAVDGWSSDPWTTRRDGNRLYGLGAADMKSGVAAAMLATRALARCREDWRGTVIFTAVVDEEAYSVGAHALIDSGLRSDYCIVTESAWDHPALGSVGKTLLRIDVTGRAAHASWPWAGVNAATEAARLVARLDEIPIQEHPRMRGSRAVLNFSSGNDQYVITVPEKARVILNRMIVAGERSEDVVAEVQSLVDDLDSPAAFEISVDPPYYPPWETSPEHPLARAVASAYIVETGREPEWGYGGFGDMNLFSEEAGIPTVMIGPRGDKFHQANEWVDVPSIAATTRLLVRVARTLLPAG
jgi:acetylornithine deacetylase/succinyl-diaminopimelate desuccinylase-like protein